MNLHSEEVTWKGEMVVKSYGGPRSLKSPYIPWKSSTSLCKESHDMIDTHLRHGKLELELQWLPEKKATARLLRETKRSWEGNVMNEWRMNAWEMTPESRKAEWKWSVVAQSCLILWTPWTVAYQAPPSMGFYSQEYWSGLPFAILCSTANFSFLLYRKRKVGQSSAKVPSCFKAPRF